jgi:type IV secretion system protein VirB6
MAWGLAHWRGVIQEPLAEGVRRLLTLGCVLGVALQLWAYDAVLVDWFFRGPAQLAAAVLGAPTAVTAIDQIWLDGNQVAEALLAQGGWLAMNFSIAGFVVYFLVGLTCVYGAFLMALALVAVAILLALGPLFILSLLFEATKKYFEAWIGQLVNYALVGIFVGLVAALLLTVVRAFAAAAVASGAGVTIAESIRLCLGAVLIFLLLRQIPQLAAGIGHGLSLATGHIVSSAVSRGMRSGPRWMGAVGRSAVLGGAAGVALGRLGYARALRMGQVIEGRAEAGTSLAARWRERA